MVIDKKTATFHTIVFSEYTPPDQNRFRSEVHAKLKSKLGDSFWVEYVNSIGENIENLSFCLDYVEKFYGTIDNSTTFTIKRSLWKDQQILLISWKNKNKILNRIFS